MSRVLSRRQQYSEETREALLTTAAELFVEKGFTKTALAEIAAAAQVTRGAVYHHFADKRDLYRAVMERHEERAMASVTAAFLEHEDPVDGAFAAMRAYLDHGLEPDYAELVLRQGPIALGWEEWQQAEERGHAGLIEQILTSLMAAGRITPLPIEPLAAVTFTALSRCAMDIAGSAPDDRERVREECGQVMVRLFSGLLVR